MKDSTHLKEIYDTKKGALNLQIVFSDIVDYSKRKSTIQKKVIDNFTKINQNALEELSKKHITYAQQNEININNDIIKIPTGDGLALIFIFEGLHTIHLDFAQLLLEKVHEYTICNNCQRFEEQGWCNCHDNFNLRIGLSEGKGIIYRDVNENYNVAGNVINMAARVMNLGDNNSILLTEETYMNIIDMTSDVTLEDDFESFEEIKIKHGKKLNIHQYRPKLDYINDETPTKIAQSLAMGEIRKTFSSFMPLPPEIEDENDNIEIIGKMMEGFGVLQKAFETSTMQKSIKGAETREGKNVK